MKKIKLASIGAGTHSTNALYPSLNFIDNIERVAVCDIKEELAKEIAVKFGFSKYYTDYKKMLEAENIDGVMICINAKEHPPITKECLKKGVDVFVEKPAAITPEECQEIVDLSNKTGKFVMVDHQKRRATVYLKMQEIISKKEFGDIVMIESKQHGYPYNSLFNCLIELQIHNIDILRAFGGEVKKVNAFQKKITVNRSAIILVLEFENGIIGTTHIGTEGNRGVYCERVEIVGSSGQGVLADNVRKLIHYNENDSYQWEVLGEVHGECGYSRPRSGGGGGGGGSSRDDINIVIYSPQNGITYANTIIPLQVDDLNDNAQYWMYSLNGAKKISFTPNASVAVAKTGLNTLVVYAREQLTVRREVTESVMFTVILPPPVDPGYCGDDICRDEEDCESCALDCGECIVEQVLEDGNVCGDGMCGSIESSYTCGSDCEAAPRTDYTYVAIGGVVAALGALGFFLYRRFVQGAISTGAKLIDPRAAGTIK